MSSVTLPELPQGITARLAKAKLPEGVSVSADAKVALNKSTSLFVLYLADAANARARAAKRTTINSDDIIHATEDVQFPEFASLLEQAREEFRAKNVKPAAKRPRKEKTEGTDEALTQRQSQEATQEEGKTQEEDKTQEEEKTQEEYKTQEGEKVQEEDRIQEEEKTQEDQKTQEEEVVEEVTMDAE